MTKSIKWSLVFSQLAFLILLPIWLKLTQYLHLVVIVVVWFCFTSLVLLVTCWIKQEKIILSTRILHIITLLYSLGLLILLFFRPKGQSYGSINLIPFDTIRYYLSGNVDPFIALYNLGANIGLFIPFGLYYRYINKQANRVHLLIITIGSITMIESLQFITKRGSLDIDDLLLNVLGVLLGYHIHPLIQKVVEIEKR